MSNLVDIVEGCPYESKNFSCDVCHDKISPYSSSWNYKGYDECETCHLKSTRTDLIHYSGIVKSKNDMNDMEIIEDVCDVDLKPVKILDNEKKFMISTVTHFMKEIDGNSCIGFGAINDIIKLLIHGSEGKTREELSKLVDRTNIDGKDNFVFLSGNQPVKEEFKQLVKVLPDMNAKKANDFIEKETKGKHKNVLDNIGDLTICTIKECECEWNTEFTDVRKDMKFDNNGKIDMMFDTKPIKCHVTDNYVAIAIKTKNMNKYIIHIMPRKCSLENFISSLPDAIENFVRFSRSNKKWVGIPKIKIEEKTGLDRLLQKNGINSAYIGGFTKIIDANLQLTSTCQSIVYSIDEKGGKASAVVYATLSKGIDTVSFTFDKPHFEIFIEDGKVQFIAIIKSGNK